MSVLVFYKSTPEGAEAVRAGAVQAAFHRTTLVVHNVPQDAAEAEEVVALASGAAAGAEVELQTVPAPDGGVDGVDEFLAAAGEAGAKPRTTRFPAGGRLRSRLPCARTGAASSCATSSP